MKREDFLGLVGKNVEVWTSRHGWHGELEDVKETYLLLSKWWKPWGKPAYQTHVLVDLSKVIGIKVREP